MANNTTHSFLPTNIPTLSKESLFISDEQLKAADKVLRVLQFIAAGLAVPLTLCNVIVFLHKNMRSATAVYVIGLSVGQLVYVIGSNVPALCLLTFRDPLNDWLYMVLVLYVGVYCSIVARRGAYVVMSLVSLERLYAVVRPLHVRRFLLSRHPIICLISTYIVTAVLHVYILTKTEIKSYQKGPQNVVVYTLARTQLYLKHQAINDGFSVAAKTLLTYCGLLAQMLLNVLTIWCLQRHNTATQMMKSAAKEKEMIQRERQLTVTILVTTFSYVVLALPLAAHHLFNSIFSNDYTLRGQYGNLFKLLRGLTFLLSVLSCCVDFVCFMVLSSNYRKTFVTIFTFGKIRWTETKLSGLNSQS